MTTLYRCVALDAAASPGEQGSPLWFPRPFQGPARHDNPALYGCLYVSEHPHGAVVEALAAFRGAGALHEGMLDRGGQRLSLVTLNIDADTAELIDLDDPAVLVRENLRPSHVATTLRRRTQADAARLFHSNPGVAGLRWWSVIESSLANLTIFDRAQRALSVTDTRVLDVGATPVRDAADLLGLTRDA